MIERRVVRRYAKALHSAAVKAAAVDAVESDLGLVSYAIEGSPELLEALVSPLLEKERKHAIVREIFGGRVHELTMAYLRLLIDKRREEALTMTEEEYVLAANEARGILDVSVVSAVDLTPDQAARLNERLNHRTGKSVRMGITIDPGIIGGMTVRIGDTVIDGSVRGYLESIRDKMLE